DKALADVGMTMDEVRKYLDKHPAFANAFHRAPHMAGCTTADLVYEVGARKNRLKYMKARIVDAVTRQSGKQQEAAHKNLIDVAKRAAAKTRKKTSVVQVAPEVDPEDQARPAVPAGRKSLRVVN